MSVKAKGLLFVIHGLGHWGLRLAHGVGEAQGVGVAMCGEGSGERLSFNAPAGFTALCKAYMLEPTTKACMIEPTTKACWPHFPGSFQ